MENVSLDFTVAIPTYNGESRLPKVLEHLRGQTEVENIKWEVIVIDNNSNDKTAEVIREYQKSWNHDFPLKYFLEKNQGITYARVRAICEAKGKLIGFIDDDIHPASHWVKEAFIFGKEHPQAGAWGGQIHGNFEVEPPENFTRIKSFFAIRERGSEPHLYDPVNLSLPPGAALVFRQEAWQKSIPKQLIFKGRLGKLKLAGDDFELLLHLHKSGWEIWYNPAMHTYHQIPQWRLERNYLVTLARGCGLCVCQLRFINTNNWLKPIIFIKIFLGGLRRMLRHIIKYKVKFKNDVIENFEFEFYLSSTISPFYTLISCITEYLINILKFNYE
ncbi:MULTISPECIES: hormogonium polysaccharide biosynthesis glycosyltransferase HpsE [Nostocales]|uniref:Glycosyl transferase n=3 Tax=Nostocales TaxID=1161 RepID=A0A0C1R530_9CYAN|nr:hormogonium polysaccharide biosynthesis glycosyltransferase HpsE [Tolypothrix bouteillei]KAF3888444.1 glycosyltransferase family 2 protein [Tolypothrix bouteillei VB521301]